MDLAARGDSPPFRLDGLLDLSKRLETCWTLADILDAVAPTVDQVLGYPHTWLAVFGQVPGLVTVISHAAAQDDSGEMLRRSQSIDIPMAGDPFLAEILAADHIVVVEDARQDPRTNKDVVAALGNQTIINVPLVLADQVLGTLGLGTFGEEGVRPPQGWHLEFLGMIAGHVAVALDRVKFLEQRKRIEADLEREKEHLRVTLESIGDGVIACDLEGRVTRLNSTAARLTGWPATEAVGKPLADVFAIVNALTRQTVDNPLMKVLAEGTVVGLANHTTLLSRGGQEYQIADSAAPIRDSLGGLVGVVLVFRDVTEDYALREELRRTSDLLERTASLARVGGWEWDARGHAFRWSQESIRILGFADPDFTSWDSLFDLMEPLGRPRFEADVAGLLDQGRSFAGEWGISLPGGRTSWLGIQGFAVVEEGTVVRAYGTLQDRTAQREADQRRLELEHQLGQARKLESLGLLAGGVAHDMNNMLAAISGMAEVHRQDPGTDLSSHHGFSVILKAVDRGRALTESLLSYTRKAPSHRGPVDWNALVEEARVLLSHTTLAHVEVGCRLEEGLPAIEGDAANLEQVLVNLCINAVDAMESSVGPRRLTLTTWSDEGSVTVEVSDTGPGMDPEVLSRAREPFFTTKPRGRGTGLGLALAASTIDAHGGRLEIDSELGRGTRIQLSFPRTAVTLPASVADSHATQSGSASYVLVVDDDDLVREVILALLDAMGIRAEGVSRAEVALEKLDEGIAYDLLLLDVNMPGLGGLGGLRAVRAKRPDLAVVLTTGLASQAVFDLVAQTPGTRLLTKPFDWDGLRSVLGLG